MGNVPMHHTLSGMSSETNKASPIRGALSLCAFVVCYEFSEFSHFLFNYTSHNYGLTECRNHNRNLSHNLKLNHCLHHNNHQQHNSNKNVRKTNKKEMNEENGNFPRRIMKAPFGCIYLDRISKGIIST